MVDTKALQKDVEDILVYSQDYPFNLDAEELITQWAMAKQQFIDIFGGQTILRSSQPIDLKLTSEQQETEFHKFIDIMKDSPRISDTLVHFLQSNYGGFFSNTVVAPDSKHGVSKGAKLLKSFKHFLSDSKDVRWAQDTASQFIQKDRLNGYLYLSVDPRDFLTISENNFGWRSCQSLDGEYRTGILNYMVDDTTVIAYLAGEKQERLKCMPADIVWDNKKWRMLFHTDCNNVIYYNKQYPYTASKFLMEQIYMMFNGLLGDRFLPPKEYGFRSVVSHGQVRNFLDFNQIYVNNRVFDVRDMIDVSDYLGYCDIISSGTFTPILSLSKQVYNQICGVRDLHDYGYEKELQKARNCYGIKIGKKAVCPSCGSWVLECDTSFLCHHCMQQYNAYDDFFIACDSCGHRIYEEDETFWVEDKVGNEFAYCKKCYHEMEKT